MKCLPKTRVSSDTLMKIPGNKKDKNFTIGYLVKRSKPYENEVVMSNELTRKS